MMMQSPDSLQVKIEQRLRLMRMIWGALLMTIVAYFALSIFVSQPQDVEPNSAMSLAFIAIALSTLAISIPIKKKILAQAVEHQRPELVQQAYIIAWAITEVGALVGLVDLFATGNPYYFIPMIIAALGQILHFPNRQHVVDSFFKTPTL
jgi:hypothetical protein